MNNKYNKHNNNSNHLIKIINIINHQIIRCNNNSINKEISVIVITIINILEGIIESIYLI